MALEPGTFIVLDIGKTLAKITLWSADGRLLDRKVRQNRSVIVGGLRRLDIAGIGGWVLRTLSAYRHHPIRAIVPVGHGAGVVAIGKDGPLFAPLDYEQPLPAKVMTAYRMERDGFALTGSPALPDGLNLGSQIYWLQELYPSEFRDAMLVPWAQYWAWYLTGQAVSEVSSLGCHSDLWCPEQADYSPMARRMGWAQHFAPLVDAGAVVGSLRREIAQETGLAPTVEVLAGLHDSNAALNAVRSHATLADEEVTVLSTGTWFIAMRSTNDTSTVLPEGRDCLINVDIQGRPTPSGRFMGGREIERVVEVDRHQLDILEHQSTLISAIPHAISEGSMLLPTLAPGFGPFPNSIGRWVSLPADWTVRRSAAGLYAALVTEQMLKLIGTRDRVLVEGRFARAQVFTRALATLRPDLTVLTAHAHHDVSLGALRLIDPTFSADGDLAPVPPLDVDLAGYRASWLGQLGN